MSQFFTSGPSDSASVLPMNIQEWFPTDWLVWSPCSRTDSQDCSPTSQFKSINSLALSYSYMTTVKIRALTRWTLVSKVICLLFNMMSRLIIAFLPRSKYLLILWLQSPCTLIFEPKKIKSVSISIDSPSICHEVDVTRCHDLLILNFEF